METVDAATVQGLFLGCHQGYVVRSYTSTIYWSLVQLRSVLQEPGVFFPMRRKSRM